MKKLFALVFTVLSGLPWALQAEPLEGVEYVRLAQPQPVSTGTRIEVREFFWYGCGHCYALEPHLEKWLKHLPKNVAFVRTPGMAPNWVAHAQAYYAFESLGAVDRLHRAFFDAVQNARRTATPQAMPLSDEDSIAKFVAQHGVDAGKFREAFGSFDVGRKLGQARQLNNDYRVESVPTLFVDGRYMTNANIAGGYDKVPEVLNFLIRKAAGERGSRK